MGVLNTKATALLVQFASKTPSFQDICGYPKLFKEGLILKRNTEFCLRGRNLLKIDEGLKHRSDGKTHGGLVHDSWRIDMNLCFYV